MFAPPSSRLLPLLGSDLPEELGPLLDRLSTEDTRRALAAGLYAEERLSLAQAAQLAGMDQPAFSRHLDAQGIVSGRGKKFVLKGIADGRQARDIQRVSLAPRKAASKPSAQSVPRP